MTKMTFESAMVRLNEIAASLESGSASLEDSLKLYEEGTRLIAQCDKILKNAKLKIETFSAAAQQEEQSDDE